MTCIVMNKVKHSVLMKLCSLLYNIWSTHFQVKSKALTKTAINYLLICYMEITGSYLLLNCSRFMGWQICKQKVAENETSKEDVLDKFWNK